MIFNLRECAIELRCPKGWVMALWDAGLLPSLHPDHFEIDSEMLDEFLGVGDKYVPRGTDFRRIYRARGAAERAGVALGTLGMHRCMGWITPIRPSYQLILYREIDVLRYIEYKKDRRDMRQETIHWKREQKRLEKAAIRQRKQFRKSGRTLELVLKREANGLFYIIGWAYGQKVRVNTKRSTNDAAEAVLKEWRVSRTVPEPPPQQYLVGKLKLYPDGNWRICWFEAGRARSRNLKVTDRPAAEKALAAWERIHGRKGMLLRRDSELRRAARQKQLAYAKMPAPAAAAAPSTPPPPPPPPIWAPPKVTPSS